MKTIAKLLISDLVYFKNGPRNVDSYIRLDEAEKYYYTFGDTLFDFALPYMADAGMSPGIIKNMLPHEYTPAELDVAHAISPVWYAFKKSDKSKGLEFRGNSEAIRSVLRDIPDLVCFSRNGFQLFRTGKEIKVIGIKTPDEVFAWYQGKTVKTNRGIER